MAISNRLLTQLRTAVRDINAIQNNPATPAGTTVTNILLILILCELRTFSAGVMKIVPTEAIEDSS